MISSTSLIFDLDGDGTLDATYLAAQVAASRPGASADLKARVEVITGIASGFTSRVKLTGSGVLEIQLTNPDGSAFTPPVSMSLTDFANLQLEVFKNSGFQNLISSTSLIFDLDGDGTLDATYLAAQVAA